MEQRITSYHLTSAAHNTRLAGELEEAFDGDLDDVYQGESFRRWQPIHDSHVISSIISAFAGVEAGINEFWKDVPVHAEYDTDRLRWFYAEFEDKFREWNLSTLEKYELALTCAGVEELNSGKEPYQSVELLRKTRNYVVHYEPEWIDQNKDDKHHIAQGLETKNIGLNPFREDSSQPILPFDYFSYECGVWSVNTAIEFIDKFYSQLGSRNTYDDFIDVLLKELKTDWKETEPAF